MKIACNVGDREVLDEAIGDGNNADQEQERVDVENDEPQPGPAQPQVVGIDNPQQDAQERQQNLDDLIARMQRDLDSRMAQEQGEGEPDQEPSPAQPVEGSQSSSHFIDMFCRTHSFSLLMYLCMSLAESVNVKRGCLCILAS